MDNLHRPFVFYSHRAITMTADLTLTTPTLPEHGFLAREPILDRQLLLAGYDITLRAPAASQPELIAQAFGTLGLGRALSACRAFVQIDFAVLNDEQTLALLPSDLVVLQVDQALWQSAPVRERAQVLKARGYAFCVAGLTRAQRPDDAALGMADYVKFDLTGIAPDDLQALASDLRALRRPLLISGIATHEQQSLCALLGAEFFQGYFFAQLVASSKAQLDPSVQVVFRLIGQLAGDAEIDELEHTLRREPALIVNLLQLTNSVGVGARARITSVRHAIAVLGRRQLLRWLQLLLFRGRGQGDIARNPLMQYAALRGRFLELLATRLHPESSRLAEPAFMTGLLSVLPAALGQSMREILNEMPVADAVQLALLHHQGELGEMLAVLDAYDANDEALTSERLAPYPWLTSAMLGEILIETLGWVQSLAAEA
jgi:c-di-GMP-related signal transduction protein